jgi:hypothetical protein
MGILDEAIKEHLELKRQHGADESELKKLEDEAFGAAERPGSEDSTAEPAAEAPTQLMTPPDLEEAEAPVEEASSRGRTEIADLQESPVESVEAAEESPVESVEAAEEAPADEPSPAMEHETISEPPADETEVEVSTGPSTEERHALAEHPTEMYDVEAELGNAEPSDAEPEVHAVSEEQALSEEDEEFWDEKRLSDELDQALEAPVELQEPDLSDEPEVEPEATAEAEPSREEEPPPPRPGHEDVLDETPDFLEEAPEDDRLWFEQKPPKDFDFDE